MAGPKPKARNVPKVERPTPKRRRGLPDVEELAARARPVEPEPPAPIGMAAAVIDAADEQAGINVERDDPHRLARLHLRLAHHHPDRPTLVCQGGDWLAWNGRRWNDVTGAIKQALVRTARAEFERHNKLAVVAHEAPVSQGGKAKRPPSVRKIDTSLISNVVLALETLVAVPGERERPCWPDGGGPWPAGEVLAFPNALVHLPSFIAASEDASIEPTPRFFSTQCLPFDFDPMAPKPVRWLKFLEEILGDDQEAIDLLQEWIGYCLIPDTSQQKILMIIGSTRSGKGTIGRVLTGLLGPENVAGPGFSSLATNFGGQPLIGKRLAIVGDARLSGKSDQAIIVERLLNISGEDRVTVDCKHRMPWVGTLPTRLMLLSNELPELRDASMALANRLLIIKLMSSFLGRENPKLTDELLEERMGILLWAIEGLARLRKRGHFVAPESGRGTMTAMMGLSSPISVFVAECCVVQTDLRVPTERLYRAYKQWSARQGRKALDQNRFGQMLHAAVPGLENKRLVLNRALKKKVSCYVGIDLQPGALPNDES